MTAAGDRNEFSTAYQPVCTDKSMPSIRYYHNIIVLICTKKGFYFDLNLNLNNKNTKEEAMNTLEKHFKSGAGVQRQD